MQSLAVQTLRAIKRLAGQAGGQFVSSSPVLCNNVATLLPILCPDAEQQCRDFVLGNLDRIEIASLRQAANAILAASDYVPAEVGWSTAYKRPGAETFPIHNPVVALSIQPHYSPKSFARLLRLCQDHGVFDLCIDPSTGLATTAGGAENARMHDRRWITDILETFPLQGVQDAASVNRALLTVAHFYATPAQQEAFSRCIADPDKYRKGDRSNGPAHIFYPDTLAADPEWLANNRLESHAKALRVICQRLLRLEQGGTASGEDFFLAETAGTLTMFLLKINTSPELGTISFAQTAGLWEEIPFPGGLTHDIYQLGCAFSQVWQLLTTGCASLQPLQQAFLSKAPGLELSRVDDVIARSKLMVRRRLLAEENPCEHPKRPWDAALFWVLGDCELSNGGDAFDEAVLAFPLLEKLLDKLLRPNGIIRYAPFEFEAGSERVISPDSYLAQNYWLHPVLRWLLNGSKGTPTEAFGSGDCSDVEAYRRRANAAPANTEAQWSWTSVAANAYVRRTAAMLHALAAQQRKASADEAAMIRTGVDRATDLINRSLGRITGPGMFKSNGLPAPEWSVPEAYEFVTDAYGKPNALVGVNTPFAWGQSSLCSACTDYLGLLAQASAVNLL